MQSLLLRAPALLAGSSSGCGSAALLSGSPIIQQCLHQAGMSVDQGEQLHNLSNGFQLQLFRGMAFKKAGGTARQNPQPPSRNKYVRYLHNELVFPGHIILTQRGTKYHPGSNVGMGKDHTIYATSVGYVQFGTDVKTFPNGKSRTRTTVHVAPINGDTSPAYQELQKEMIARRAVIKRTLLSSQAHEAALFFPLPKPQQQQFDALHQRITSQPAIKSKSKK